MVDDLIKARIVFDTSGLGGLGGGLGKSAPVGGALGNTASVTKIGATMAVVGTAIVGMAAIAKKTFDFMKQASPRLQATMSIFNKSLMLVLRPIGDIMSNFLRPMALAFLRYAVKFYKGFKTGEEKTDAEKHAKALAETGVQEGETTLETTAGTIVDRVASKFTLLWGVLKGVAGIAVVIGKGFLWLLDTVLTPFQPIIAFIGDQFKATATFISELGTAIWDFSQTLDFGQLWEDITASFGRFSDTLWTAWDKMGEDYKAKIVEVWDKIKDQAGIIIKAIGDKFWTFLTVTIPGYFTTSVDLIQKQVDRIPSFFKTMFDSIKGLVEKGKSISAGSGPQGVLTGLAIKGIEKIKEVTGMGDGIITPGGRIVKTDPRDFLIATKTPQDLVGGKSGQNITINVSVNALDASSIDSNTIDKISRAVADTMKRGISGMTTESIGGF